MTFASQRYPDLASRAFNARDLDALLALLSPDFLYVDPNGQARGHAETRAREQAIFDAFPDIRVVMKPLAWGDDALAMEAVLTGTHSGPFAYGGQIAPPSGRRIETRIAAHFTFSNGLAVREDAYYDRLTLLTQLGLVRL